MMIQKFIKQVTERYKQSDVIYRSGLWFVLVTVIDQAISILTQPILNRIMSVEEIGVYSIYNTWNSIFSIIFTCNLFGGVLEVYITKHEEDRRQIVGSLMTLSLMISCVFILFNGLFIHKISQWTGLKPYYFPVMALSIVSNAIIQFWSVPKRFQYKYREYSILIVSLFFVKCTLSVILTYLFFQDRVLGRIVGLSLPAGIVSVVLFIKMMKGVQLKKIAFYWKRAICYNIPLLPHYLSSILLASSDRIMIQRICGDYEAGLYSTVYLYSNLSLIIFNALNSSYTPFAMKAIVEGEHESLAKKTKEIVQISIAFSILMMIFAPEGMIVLGGTKFLGAIDIIPVLIFGIYISSSYYIFSNVEFVYEKTKFIFPITVIGALVNILLNFFLLPSMGYKVAAYTTVIGYLFITILHAIVAINITKKDIFQIKQLLRYIGGFVFCGFAIALGYTIPIYVRAWIYGGAGLIVVSVILKKMKLNKT